MHNKRAAFENSVFSVMAEAPDMKVSFDVRSADHLPGSLFLKLVLARRAEIVNRLFYQDRRSLTRTPVGCGILASSIARVSLIGSTVPPSTVIR